MIPSPAGIQTTKQQQHRARGLSPSDSIKPYLRSYYTTDNPMKQIKKTYRHAIICLLLAAATLIVYGKVGKFEFISFDDSLYVYKNPQVIRGLNGDAIPWAFSLSGDVGNQAYWHPLTWLSHMADCQMFGLDAGKHHLVSMAVHLVNVIVLYFAFYLMTGGMWQSAFVAALFAVHPLNVDSVAWIAERKNVLSTLFWFLTMLAYTHYARRTSPIRYLLVCAAMSAGLLAKPMLVTLPCVLLLLDFWPLGRLQWACGPENAPRPGHFQPASPSRLIAEKIPLLAFSFLSIAASVVTLHHQNQFLSDEIAPMGLRIANAIVSYPKYLSKIIWPQDMAIYYPFPSAFPAWQTVGALIFLAGVFALTILFLKKAPYLAVGWLWFMGTLAPVIGIMQGGHWPAIADRWTYVPAIGVFIIAAWGGAAITRKYPIPKIITAISAILVISGLALLATQQTSHWQNNITLFSRALEVTQNNSLAHYNLAVALSEKGDVEQAIHHYQKGLNINPNMVEGHNNLGNILIKKGMINQAIAHFQQAVKIQPQFTEASTNLGNALAKKGNWDEALYHYENALSGEGTNTAALKNRDAMLSLLPPTERATALFNTAVRFAGEKNYGKAVALFQGILAISPDSPTIYYNISCLHAIQGRKAEAVDWLRRAVEKGYDNWEKLKTDPDLNNIRNEAGYRSLIKEAEKTAMQP